MQCQNIKAPMQKLKGKGGQWLNIFLDYKFMCNGVIEAWEFYAQNLGAMYVGVWRPVNCGENLNLTGKNLIHVTKLGHQVVVNTIYS